jgi:3-oxoacyl-[acyl-carrier-protein] synthase II
MTLGHRVVITGMGVRSPIGNTPESMWQALLSKQSGVRVVEEWGALDGLRTRVGAPCEGIQASEIPRKNRRTMGRVGILGVLAARDAIQDSGMAASEIESHTCGVSFGSTAGSSTAQEEFLYSVLHEKTIRGLQASAYLQFMSHTCANIA